MLVVVVLFTSMGAGGALGASDTPLLPFAIALIALGGGFIGNFQNCRMDSSSMKFNSLS